MKEYKVVVMGSGGVGKSALTVQYVQSVFVEKYDPTIEDSYRKVIDRSDSNQEDLSLDILDTAGTEQFTAMRDMYMKNGDAFMLVYSVTSPATLHDLQALRERLAKVKPAAKVMLVGNKADLAGDRVVSRAQGEAIAAKWACPFVETSAKDAKSVDKAFAVLIEELEKPATANGSRRYSNGQSTSDQQQQSANETGKSKKKKKKCIIA